MMKIEAGKYYKTLYGDLVGPMEVLSDYSATYRGRTFCNELGNGKVWTVDGIGHNDAKGEDLISEWSEGPVRTVTRREIVPGTYGCVEVDVYSYGMNVVADFSGGRCTAEELREAAHIFNQLAEALEDKP